MKSFDELMWEEAGAALGIPIHDYGATDDDEAPEEPDADVQPE